MYIWREDDNYGIQSISRNQNKADNLKKSGVISCRRSITIFKTDNNPYCKVIIMNSSINNGKNMIFGDPYFRKDNACQHFLNIYTMDCELDVLESIGIERQFLNGLLNITSMKTIHRFTDYNENETTCTKTPNLYSDNPMLKNYRVTDILGVRDINPLIDPRYYTQEHEFQETGDCNEYGIICTENDRFDFPYNIKGRDLIDPFTKVFLKPISEYNSSLERKPDKYNLVLDTNIADETIDMVNLDNNHGDTLLLRAQFVYDSLSNEIKHDNRFMFDGFKYMLKEDLRLEVEAINSILLARGKSLEMIYGNIIIFYRIDPTGSYCRIVLRDHKGVRIDSTNMGEKEIKKNHHDEITSTIFGILDFDNNGVYNDVYFNPFSHTEEDKIFEFGNRMKYGLIG
jgi:hypothetical protein